MTTKQLIEKAYDLTAKYFDITDIKITNSVSYSIENDEYITIQVFYTFRKLEGVITASITKKYDPENYNVDHLLLKLKANIEFERKKIYPFIATTSDLTIE